MEKRAHQPKPESELEHSAEQLSKQRDHMGIAAVDACYEYCGGEAEDMAMTQDRRTRVRGAGDKKARARTSRSGKTQYWEPGERVTSSSKFNTGRTYTREEYKYVVEAFRERSDIDVPSAGGSF